MTVLGNEITLQDSNKQTNKDYTVVENMETEGKYCVAIILNGKQFEINGSILSQLHIRKSWFHTRRSSKKTVHRTGHLIKQDQSPKVDSLFCRIYWAAARCPLLSPPSTCPNSFSSRPFVELSSCRANDSGHNRAFRLTSGSRDVNASTRQPQRLSTRTRAASHLRNSSCSSRAREPLP